MCLENACTYVVIFLVFCSQMLAQKFMELEIKTYVSKTFFINLNLAVIFSCLFEFFKSIFTEIHTDIRKETTEMVVKVL